MPLGFLESGAKIGNIGIWFKVRADNQPKPMSVFELPCPVSKTWTFHAEMQGKLVS